MITGAVGACALDVGVGIFADAVTDNEQDETYLKNGADYMGFLGDLGKVGKAFL